MTKTTTTNLPTRNASRVEEDAGVSVTGGIIGGALGGLAVFTTTVAVVTYAMRKMLRTPGLKLVT